MITISQYETIGKTLAELIRYATAWEEPLNGDDIQIIVNSFQNELKMLNGDQ